MMLNLIKGKYCVLGVVLLFNLPKCVIMITRCPSVIDEVLNGSQQGGRLNKIIPGFRVTHVQDVV